MGLSSLNKYHFHFVCTNYGSNKDGIGHYTSKIVSELKKNDSFIVSVYSSKTHDLSKIKLFLSLRMSLQLIKLLKSLHKSSNKSAIILEYPFVEYNPIFLVVFWFLKILKRSNSKIVISLHEYSRTKIFRKLFIKMLIPLSDIILFTKDEDIRSFLSKKITFKKRIIPANIEPAYINKTKTGDALNICFFGIINFKTKEINNMLSGWELYAKKSRERKMHFHFISSTDHQGIRANEYVDFHYGLEDDQVSNLLQKMQFMILPLKPKVSINNGSLSVGCIHKCIPVGMFDDEYFHKGFGLNMKNYSIQEFEKVFNLIDNFDVNSIKKKRDLAYEYGRLKSIINSIEPYSGLIEIQ